MDTNLYRVAVCLSGQPRYWRYCIDNIKHHFETHSILHDGRPIEVDYFIHAWDINTWREPKTQRDICYDEKHDDLVALTDAFSPKSIEVEEYSKHNFIRAWDPMFYSHHKCLMMKRDYELENKFQYDLVIKARPDIIYNPQFSFIYERVFPLVCYTGHIGKFPGEFNANNFDDVIFYGDSPTMDLVGDIYHTNVWLLSEQALDMAKTGYDINITTYFGPGCLLYEHFMRIGIRPERRGRLDYSVMRKTMVETGLSTHTHYSELKKINQEWYI